MILKQKDSLPLSPVLFLNLSLFSLPLSAKLQNRKPSLILSEITTRSSRPATTNMGFEILKQSYKPELKSNKVYSNMNYTGSEKYNDFEFSVVDKLFSVGGHRNNHFFWC